MKKAKMLALTASVCLAITFTLSCSSDDGDGEDSISYGGEQYGILKIGDQIWMKINLEFEPLIGNSTCSGKDFDGKCVARLYDWSTAMALPQNCNSKACSSQIQPKHKGICPDGWHIPSRAEWDVLWASIVNTDIGLKLHLANADRKGWWLPSESNDNNALVLLMRDLGLPDDKSSLHEVRCLKD
jgi:uncharacterized protein (TIGR02145 family)